MKTKAVVSLSQYLEMGGIANEGMILFTSPCLDSPEAISQDNFYSKHTKFYTLLDITDKGVVVKEKSTYLGTGWLFVTVDIILYHEK